jgi:hypothetical protein
VRCIDDGTGSVVGDASVAIAESFRPLLAQAGIPLPPRRTLSAPGGRLYAEGMSDRPSPGPPELPPDVPPEYAEAYLRGYERAYAETAELASAPPLPGQVPEPAEQQHEPSAPAGEQPPDDPAEPWQFEPLQPPEASNQWESEPTRTSAFENDLVDQPQDDEVGQDERTDTTEQDVVEAGDQPGPVVPGFALWEGREEWYDEPPDAGGYPRWVMPLVAVCLLVLLFVAVYLLA